MTTNICANGQRQSPINIKTSDIVKCNVLCDLVFYYRTSKCNIVHVDNDIILEYDSGSYVTYNSNIYELNKIAFTVPASHKIDNFSYPAEAQLYHRSTDTGELLIISVFLDVNDATSKSRMFFDMFADIIPLKSGQRSTVNTGDTWNIYHIIPEAKSFYNYKGSLPRSPCSENILWVVFDNSINCSTNFFDKLKIAIPSNARSLQNINGRTIYFNINNNDKNKRNYGDSMRCYEDKEFREQCSKLSNNTEIITAKNKQALIITACICIIIALILFILWLGQQDFFKVMLDKARALLGQKIFTSTIKILKNK